MIYVFDTDHLSLNQRFDPRVTVCLKRFDYREHKLLTTVISHQEQMAGRFEQIHRAKDSVALVEAYRLFKTTIDYFKPWQFLDFDDQAERHFQSARKSSIRIGTMDLRIASICIVNNAILVTRNRKDFQQVPDLKFEDWSV
jgi:tRNA(fMet)-specific endonuclease VapC